MKQFLPALFLALSPTLDCLAQSLNDSLEKRPPKLIIQTGIGMQLYGGSYLFSNLSIETPLGSFCHVGIQGAHLFAKGFGDSFFSAGALDNEFLGGFEAGGFAKFFLHGRRSGHKSALYFGPEFRYGTLRRGGEYFGDIFPAFYTYKTTQHTYNYLVRCGTQWRLGRYALLELALPFGWQHSKFTYKNTVNDVLSPSVHFTNGKFIILPTFQIGIAF